MIIYFFPPFELITKNKVIKYLLLNDSLKFTAVVSSRHNHKKITPIVELEIIRTMNSTVNSLTPVNWYTVVHTIIYCNGVQHYTMPILTVRKGVVACRLANGNYQVWV